ncbi:1634_t:CDS:2, partial [Gigaspora margarita]
YQHGTSPNQGQPTSQQLSQGIPSTITTAGTMSTPVNDDFNKMLEFESSHICWLWLISAKVKYNLTLRSSTKYCSITPSVGLEFAVTLFISVGELVFKDIMVLVSLVNNVDRFEDIFENISKSMWNR